MNRPPLSLGKIRALQRTTTADGIFTVLALDHQDSLRTRLNPDAPLSIPDNDIIQFKHEVIGSLAPLSSGVLLDPVFGAGQAIQTDILHHTGLLVELEQADYSMEPLPLVVDILPNWSGNKIKRMGADGVKLFFYYNPDDKRVAEQQDTVVRQAVDDCAKYDIPLFAEPILYPYPADTTSFAEDRTRLLIDTATHFDAMRVDILKLEFPIDINLAPDDSLWETTCRQLSDAIHCPWLLLSAGVDYATFLRQVDIACSNGASGFIGGRAIWGEACSITDSPSRLEWLATTGQNRVRQLSDITRQSATPWTDILQTEPISTTWYQEYDSC